MCKPGSASGGSGLASGGLGLAFAVVGIAGVVSMATAFISTIITAALITVFSLAAAGTVGLVVILCRTRNVVTWPMRTTMPSAASASAIATLLNRSPPVQAPPCTSSTAGNGPGPIGWYSRASSG